MAAPAENLPFSPHLLKHIIHTSFANHNSPTLSAAILRMYIHHLSFICILLFLSLLSPSQPIFLSYPITLPPTTLITNQLKRGVSGPRIHKSKQAWQARRTLTSFFPFLPLTYFFSTFCLFLPSLSQSISFSLYNFPASAFCRDPKWGLHSS